ncbi:MAG TPA: serine/threonine-protein kinase [Gemmatimonadales bacterium]|nr:serine/threonine-protein kinase [Gemmatimonadales bacterium]
MDGTPLVEVPFAAPPTPPARPALRATPRARLSDADRPAVPAADAERFRSLSGTLLDDRYDIGQKIGEGGMSWVYEAIERGTGQNLAIKVLPPRLTRDRDSTERLRREAGIATRFDHPNVCPILRLGETKDGILYVVMPYLAGETLGDYENRVREIPLEEGIAILMQVCHGLQHAHDRGVVHRDLKPENVMLVPEGIVGESRRAVVMDFGLAKERAAGVDVARLTQTGIVLGTPEFMSPEQIRGRTLDGRSDVYALGVLAFELFTGELPFTGKNAQEMMVARLRGLPRPLRSVRPDLPARLEAVINRALALEADDRYQSMEEFATALDGVLQGGMLARLFRRR